MKIGKTQTFEINNQKLEIKTNIYINPIKLGLHSQNNMCFNHNCSCWPELVKCHSHILLVEMQIDTTFQERILILY